jgi:hypothetical protein
MPVVPQWCVENFSTLTALASAHEPVRSECFEAGIGTWCVHAMQRLPRGASLLPYQSREQHCWCIAGVVY